MKHLQRHRKQRVKCAFIKGVYSVKILIIIQSKNPLLSCNVIVNKKIIYHILKLYIIYILLYYNYMWFVYEG